ncbi:MAG TPA: M28 family metallopeptidase [Gemmatimonadaceae bacterium]|nr:M28 family metallopeptidase [Gemmatimonadaceae bacterium]
MRNLIIAATAATGLTACATAPAIETPVAPISAVPVPEQPAPVTPAVPQISLETLKEVTRTLASDEFEGRAPTTAGEDKTIALIANRFQQAGLQPGNKGSWFQDVPLVETTATPTALRFIGGKQPLTFQWRKDMVANSYQATPSINLNNSDVVFVGYGINAPERSWNDYAGVDVKGKTVVILVNDPDYQTQGTKGLFNGRAMTYYGRWTYKYEEAARQGASAALIVHDTEPASYGWNVVQSSWTGPQYNMAAANNGMDQSKVVGWLTNDAAKQLFAAAGKNLGQLSAAAKQPGFKAVPFGMKASISLKNQIKRQNSKNVIGILPGTTRPNEKVIYTAHWDHLGICDADATGDNICNGALDNATGTAGLIALAEAHARAGRPDRSIIFLAVTAEESGLLGSKYYGENPIYPHAQTVGGINMDGLNIGGDTRDVVVIGPGKSQLEDYLKRAAADLNLTVKSEPTPEAGYYYRSDHFSLAKFGVPMLYADSGEDLVDGGLAAGKAAADDYRANRYHQPSDEYDPNWDWMGAIRDLGIYYRIGRELAGSDAWPNWYEGDEFRAIRDRSRAGQ